MTTDVYPCTIVSDRYGGAYSGANWLAFNTYEDGVPGDVQGGDIECWDFWKKFDGVVGKGETPSEALEDLSRKLETIARFADE